MGRCSASKTRESGSPKWTRSVRRVRMEWAEWHRLVPNGGSGRPAESAVPHASNTVRATRAINLSARFIDPRGSPMRTALVRVHARDGAVARVFRHDSTASGGTAHDRSQLGLESGVRVLGMRIGESRRHRRIVGIARGGPFRWAQCEPCRECRERNPDQDKPRHALHAGQYSSIRFERC